MSTADQLLVGLCREVMEDLVTHQLLLSEAEVKGYVRREHGRLEEVRPHLEGNAVHEHLGRPGMSEDQELSLERYQMNGSLAINGYLRGDKLALNYAHMSRDEAAQHIKDIDGLFSPVAQPLAVYRGVENPARFSPGTEFTDDGYASTTTEPSVARLFSGGFGGAVVRIAVPAGARALSVASASHEDLHGPVAQNTEEGLNEREVLLPRGSRFRVTGRHGDVIDAELVR